MTTGGLTDLISALKVLPWANRCPLSISFFGRRKLCLRFRRHRELADTVLVAVHPISRPRWALIRRPATWSLPTASRRRCRASCRCAEVDLDAKWLELLAQPGMFPAEDGAPRPAFPLRPGHRLRPKPSASAGAPSARPLLVCNCRRCSPPGSVLILHLEGWRDRLSQASAIRGSRSGARVWTVYSRSPCRASRRLRCRARMLVRCRRGRWMPRSGEGGPPSPWRAASCATR